MREFEGGWRHLETVSFHETEQSARLKIENELARFEAVTES